jgi:hypothetical protein
VTQILVVDCEDVIVLLVIVTMNEEILTIGVSYSCNHLAAESWGFVEVVAHLVYPVIVFGHVAPLEG